MVLKDGRVLTTEASATELQALVERRSPGRVGLRTTEGYLLVAIEDIERVEPALSG